MKVWIIILVTLVAVAIFAAPGISRALKRQEMTRTLAEARSFQQATAMMSLDRKASEEPHGLPADLGVKSLRQYIDLLVKDGYLTQSDATEFLRYGFLVANASAKDPPDMAYILTKEYGDMKAGKSAGRFSVFLTGGGGGTYGRPSDLEHIRLPDRQPQILPRE